MEMYTFLQVFSHNMVYSCVLFSLISFLCTCSPNGCIFVNIISLENYITKFGCVTFKG